MTQTPIFTIGYGSREIDEFLAILKHNDIAFLIDVRSQPYSRYKPDFSRQELSQHVQNTGIRYVYMGQQLGGRPTNPESQSNGSVDYDKMRQTDAYQAGIGRLQDAHSQQFRVAIMCSEGKPENCHRSRLIGETLTERGIPVAHIDENNEPISQAEVRLRLNGQLDLFAAAPQPAPTASRAIEPAVLLKQIFGYDEFRPLQEELIANVLNKQDSLAVMPTGSGKSICYQLPALIFPGLTVVVSPLISLMQDQIEQLREVGITAVTLNSSLSQHQYLDNLQQIQAGAVSMLYVAPETLLRPDLLDLLSRIPVDCLTIDEAHCISEWGHDFRPEYRQLIDVRRRLPQAVCLTVTATATDHVRADIKNSLAIADADEFIASFNRENLFLSVQPKTDGVAQTLAFLNSHADESGIIYCTTRKQVDMLTAQLHLHGYQALPYHAGLDDATRSHNQRQFIYDNVPIMVATIAFGMGINKSNVRFILHYDLPKNLESYYQQIGRAGRDGLRSDCLLLFSYSDVQTINYFIMQQDPSQQIGARTRLDAMLSFVETTICRRRPLLSYFGETFAANSCDTCDNCTAEEGELVDVTIPAQKFLSCVKRTGEMFGATYIIDVLRGSRSQKILDRGHDRLSTYNIGGEYGKKEWQFLARQFIQQGLLVQDMEHGSLKLTEAGYAVFSGASVQGTLPEQTPVQASTPLLTPHDVDLFHLLREKRKELADAQGVPPYVIFSDKTLVEMAIYFPQSAASFGQIYGVGAAKLEKYADEFLPLMQAYCREKGIAEKGKTAVTASSGRTVLTPSRPRSNKSRTEEVADLFNEGQSIPEIAQIFGIKHSTVLDHLWKTVQNGRELRPDDEMLALSQLSAEQQKQVLAVFAELGHETLSPVFRALGEAISYEELHLLRLYSVTRNEV